VEELGFELTSVVGGDRLRATETGDPAGHESVCDGFGCDVRNGDGFWPSYETVYCIETVCETSCHWKWSYEVDVNLTKTGCWRREISRWGSCVVVVGDVILSRNVSYVSRELGDVVQVIELSG
jgi:hypothetical protein